MFTLYQCTTLYFSKITTIMKKIIAIDILKWILATLTFAWIMYGVITAFKNL